MESKYLTFEKQIIEGRKTPIYIVVNKSGDSLGIIYFYPAWRKYVFSSYPKMIYDSGCLTDIINFIAEIQAEWKQSLKEKK